MTRTRAKTPAGADAAAGRARDGAAPVYLFYGADEYAVSAAAAALVEKRLSPEQRVFGLEIVDARAGNAADAALALKRCIMALQTVGFLDGRKVVWLSDASFLDRGTDGLPEDVAGQMKSLIAMLEAGLPEGQTLLVTAPAADGRSAFVKTCKDRGEVREFDVPAKAYLQQRQAGERLAQELRRHGLRAPEAVMARMLERTGYDTRQIVTEAEKLAVYLGERKEVRPEDVAAIVSPVRELEAWDLADAMGARRLPEALVILRNLLFSRTPWVVLLSTVATRIRELRLYRTALDRGWLVDRGRDVAWEALPEDVERGFAEVLDRDPRSTHPYRAKLLAEQARNFTAREIRRCEELVQAANARLVSSQVSERLVLELMLIRMLRRASPRG